MKEQLLCQRVKAECMDNLSLLVSDTIRKISALLRTCTAVNAV